MWTAGVAQAAPDDTSAGTTVGAADNRDASTVADTGSSRSESTLTPKRTRAQMDPDESVADDESGDGDEVVGGDESMADDESVVGDEVIGGDGWGGTDLDVTAEDGNDDAGGRSVKGAATTLIAEQPVAEEPGADDGPGADTVDLAIGQIADAREDLNGATWDSGNVLAGLAALLPQMWLGGAQVSLERWQENHLRLQERFAATVGNPFAHWIAGQRIEASIQRTVRVQEQLESAAKFLDVVGWFGPRDAMPQIAELIRQAATNGLVYQIIELDVEVFDGDRANPIMMLSINGGAPVRVLIDTGSFGLVINPQVIGLKDLGSPVGAGSGCYASCTVVYDYNIYNIPIATDDNIISARTEINVVTLETWNNVAENNTDYQGILGIGPKAGPGDSNPLTALPGLLGRGMLLQERRGRAILGPNPYAARVTIDGTPNAELTVKVGDNDAQVIDTWIDSGGIMGTVPKSLIGGAENVAPGTLISVYTKDGQTLLFSYRTTKSNSPLVTDGDRVIMGFPAFAGASVYTDFSGEGKTVFNYV
ncbi:PecA family PE domain-processing aspartic protease [Mycobacterium sp. smrl_JER01]|uniref:PecA family PE domain-processing aspartic protease n=1 Tax=Mycobacterium sp. smrl_JER01 TaxID=3402633 RepID=UPI003AD7B7B3